MLFLEVVISFLLSPSVNLWLVRTYVLINMKEIAVIKVMCYFETLKTMNVVSVQCRMTVNFLFPRVFAQFNLIKMYVGTR